VKGQRDPGTAGAGRQREESGRAAGWTAPASGYPTGAEWIASYLVPLAATLGDHVRYGMQVTGVSGRGRGRLVDSGREEQPFTVHITGADGTESRSSSTANSRSRGPWSRRSVVFAPTAVAKADCAGSVPPTVLDFSNLSSQY
jgi:hypothetical protein